MLWRIDGTDRVDVHSYSSGEAVAWLTLDKWAIRIKTLHDLTPAEAREVAAMLTRLVSIAEMTGEARERALSNLRAQYGGES